MERLTKRLSSGAPTYNYPASCYFDDDSGPDKIAQSAFRQRCVERLADYEDSACEPEEVLPKDKADEIALKLMRLADLESLCNYTRLRELAEPLRNGGRFSLRWMLLHLVEETARHNGHADLLREGIDGVTGV